MSMSFKLGKTSKKIYDQTMPKNVLFFVRTFTASLHNNKYNLYFMIMIVLRTRSLSRSSIVIFVKK